MSFSRICCILDLDGFSLDHINPPKFLVRELGYVQTDPEKIFLAQSYRFDLRSCETELNNPAVHKTLKYQSERLIGMCVFPHRDEKYVIPIEKLDSIVEELYRKCKNPNKDVIAYKGGHREKDLLKRLNIPSLDLQLFGCPKFQDILDSSHGTVFSDCGQHRLSKEKVIHCPLAEVTAFRDWYQDNFADIIKYEEEEDSDSDW